MRKNHKFKMYLINIEIGHSTHKTNIFSQKLGVKQRWFLVEMYENPNLKKIYLNFFLTLKTPNVVRPIASYFLSHRFVFFLLLPRQICTY